MKKDIELLEAARVGNILNIQKLILPQKSTSWTFAPFGLKSRVNIDCQDLSGYTPLHHAALNGHKDVVEVLLQNSASANIGDVKGNYPLHLASWNGHNDIVKTLLFQGPSIAKINEKNGDNETALHCAAQHGHSQTTEVLLQHGGDPSVRNVRGESPLDLASQYGRLGVVQLLLSHQPSLLKRFPQSFSPLHVASRNGHKEVVELLIAHGADVNCRAENGTALHEAALFGKLEVVKLLLTRGADPHLLDHQNRTPLELIKQLDTNNSREISQIISEKMQDGDDYEPLASATDFSLASTANRDLLSVPSALCSSQGLIEDEHNHSESDLPVLKPDITLTKQEEPFHDQNVDKTLNASVTRSQTVKGLSQRWSRYSMRKLGLRRSASARNSKSLPRLPSASQTFPSAESFKSTSRFHPSSNMFPAASDFLGRFVAPTSASVLSLPAAVSSHHLHEKSTHRFSQLNFDEDNVFVSASRHFTAQSFRRCERPCNDSTTCSQDPGQTSSSPHPTSPQKPIRHKLFTHSLGSSPLFSTPDFQGQGRPPSPAHPPPDDDEFSSTSDEDCSLDCDLSSGNRDVPCADVEFDEHELSLSPEEVKSADICEWSDALSDRTEDFDMPEEIRRFRGLTRGSCLKPELQTTPQHFSPPHHDEVDGAQDGSRKIGEPSLPDRTDSPTYTDNADGALSRRLPDIDTIKHTVAAIRSQRGSKSESLRRDLATRPELVDSEWTQITDAMATMSGESDRESVYAKQFEQTFWKIMTGASLPHHVGSWLMDLGLPQYETVLEVNGFDNLLYLGGSILNEKDLLDMNITNPNHRERMLKSLPPSSTPSLAPLAVEEWLAEIELPQYSTLFVESGRTEVAQMRAMTAEEIHQIIPKLGHAKRVVAMLQRTLTSQASKHEDNSQRSSSEDAALEADTPPQTPSTAEGKSVQGEEAMCALPSPAIDVPAPDRAAFLSQAQGIHLRPPNVATREVSVSAWRHPPDTLINSCCNYQAYYLGSMLIHELKGVESTKEACAKMKRSTDAMKKIPTITLSINYAGVKFIDFKSKHEIAEHEIQNISFASQDALDLSTFAYVTHDVKTGHHYCHVFRVTTMDMAYEIILTLGQAFEVAYQLIMKEKALKAA